MFVEFITGIRVFCDSVGSIINLVKSSTDRNSEYELIRFTLLLGGLHNGCNTLIESFRSLDDTLPLQLKERNQRLKKALDEAVSAHAIVAQYYYPNSENRAVVDALGIYVSDILESGYVAFDASGCLFMKPIFVDEIDSEKLDLLQLEENFSKLEDANHMMEGVLCNLRKFISTQFKIEAVMKVSADLLQEKNDCNRERTFVGAHPRSELLKHLFDLD